MGFFGGKKKRQEPYLGAGPNPRGEPLSMAQVDMGAAEPETIPGAERVSMIRMSRHHKALMDDMTKHAARLIVENSGVLGERQLRRDLVLGFMRDVKTVPRPGDIDMMVEIIMGKKKPEEAKTDAAGQ